MLFASTVFLYLFLPITLFGYYVIFRKWRPAQNVFLLLASLFFYAWGEPKFVLVMILSIFCNWAFGLLVDKAKRAEKFKLQKCFVTLACLFNLGLLFIFKYLNFSADVLNRVFGIGIEMQKIVLPIGISFFTFQALSYVIDISRGEGNVQKNILNVGLYISFFPQLIAGPIVRYQTVADEIANRKETWGGFYQGLIRFILGLAKKVLLANSFAYLADRAFDTVAEGAQISVLFSWLGVIGYALQIYFDFGGYSDMAIGLGRMFGFHFLENFDHPYISHSITEFWRRWHISLGTWFRDYLYIPLGGSRVKKSRLVLNLLIVWALTGFWHGANWTYLLWGLMYFVLLTFEKLTGFDRVTVRGIGWLKILYTLFFVLIGWAFFRADNLNVAVRYLGMMFGTAASAFADSMFWSYLGQNAVHLMIGILLSTPLLASLFKKISKTVLTEILCAVGVLALFVLTVSVIVADSYNPFIYFNF